MGIIERLRQKYDEPYRIRAGYGLSPIRNEREMKALIDFCKREIRDWHEYNFVASKHRWVALMTVRLYEGRDVSELLSIEEYIPYKGYNPRLDDFIDDHVGWYWS